MSNIAGIVNVNYHKTTKILDAKNQCAPISDMETMYSVTDLVGQLIEYTITDNVATITETGYIEGSEVCIYLYCFRISEGGGPSQQKIIGADELQLETLKLETLKLNTLSKL